MLLVILYECDWLDATLLPRSGFPPFRRSRVECLGPIHEVPTFPEVFFFGRPKCPTKFNELTIGACNRGLVDILQ